MKGKGMRTEMAYLGDEVVYQAKLNASLARTLSVALKVSKLTYATILCLALANLSLRGMTVETRLSSAISPPTGERES